MRRIGNGRPGQSGQSRAIPADTGDSAQVESAVESTPAVINPNLAGSDDLGMLPGMTTELADAVLGARPFMDMIELDGWSTGT